MFERLEVEVECGRLTVGSDRCIESDVGLKQKLMDMLFSYNTVWLKLGLEVRTYVYNVRCVLTFSIYVRMYVHRCCTVHMCVCMYVRI